MPNAEPTIIKPQAGPQHLFLKIKVDFAVFGGGAGGGKSYGLLLKPLQQYENPDFGSVIFRRNTVQVRNQGGLWDTSFSLYSGLRGAHPREAILEWEFQSGCRVKFAHLENEHTVYDYQGAQIPLIQFDELTHFTEKQVFYMFSRLRSMSGVPGRIRATCNPDADSWVRRLIDWYIGEDGFPIKERSGVIRWWIRQDDSMIWGDSREELIERYGADQQPKSFTFIQSMVHDNKILMEKDPTYLSNLMALSRVERMRLLGGNWNVRASAGMMFQREWFPIVDAVPSGWIQMVRYWDRAATRPSEVNKDPDWTRGLKLYKYPDGTFCVVDLKSIRDTPGQVESLIKNTASHDSWVCPIVGEQDPGSAGVADANNFVSMLAGYEVRTRSNSRDKLTRAKPVSAQAEVGNIKVLRAGWNDAFFHELENFPEGAHDDIVDVLSGAFNELAGGMSLADVL
jgi:predicted phage terminase large subunit-like protein